MTWETFFLKNHKQNVMEKLFPYPFLKNQNWAYLWINSFSFLQLVFILCHVEDYSSILKLSCRPLPFTSYKAFLKNKNSCKTSLLASFSEWFFFKKIFLLLYSITWQIFIVWLFLLCGISSNMCVVIVC